MAEMRILIKIIFVLIFVLFCFHMGAKISFDAHMKIYDTLLTISGILFGVFGLWVSILYPGILEKSLEESGKTEIPAEISNRSNQLLRPMFISLFLFLVMVSVIFLAPFLQALDLSQNIRSLMKCISASMAGLVFLVLVDSILQSMDQTEAFQSLITHNATFADMKNRFMAGIRRAKRKGE